MVIILKKSDSKRTINRKLKNLKTSKPIKPFNAKKYNGIIKLKEDPLKIQIELRDEWDRDDKIDKIVKQIRSQKKIK